MNRWLRQHLHHLRWQLVAGFTLSVALLLVLLIGTERVLVQRSLTESITRNLSASLDAEIKPATSSVVFTQGSVAGTSISRQDTSTTQPAQAILVKSAAAFVTNLAATDQPAAFVDAGGTIRASAGDLKTTSQTTQALSGKVVAALATEAHRHRESSGIWTGTVRTPGGDYLEIARPITVFSLPALSGVSVSGSILTQAQPSTGTSLAPGVAVATGGIAVQSTSGVLLLAHSLADTEQTVQTVTMISIFGAAVVLVLTVLLALVVVRSALRPLATITVGVERLAEGEYAYRLAAPSGTDEVGRLATAFDRMAGAVGTAFAKQRRFVADASHELRTPLTALRGYTDVLLLGVRDDPDTADRVLHAMQDDLTRMTTLVNDLLTLARLDGEQALRLQPLALQPLLSAARDEAAIIAGDLHTVTLEVPEESEMVLADAIRLRQVFSNVLGNACAYATDHTPIQIRAVCHPATVVVMVSDCGPGIPPEDLARLGERFYRGDSARSRRTGGTGLGIAIARGIMKAHGGSLEIDSVLGTGTTVAITIPRARH